MSRYDYSEYEDMVFSDEEIEQSSTRDYETIPDDTYICSLEKIEHKFTKEKQQPMLSIIFKIQDGEYLNRLIFVNKVLLSNDSREKNAQRFYFAKKILKELQIFDEEDIKFSTYKELKELIIDCSNEVEKINNNYKVKKTTSKSGFENYDIVGIE